MSDGDVALPGYSFRPGYGDRRYRRDDSDELGDRFRLYELAGVPHMGTRYAPFDDVSLWQATHGDEARRSRHHRPRMNSLPHFELFAMGLDHLVRVGGRRHGAAAGRAPRGRPRRLLRQGRARQHPRRRALRAARRPALDLPAPTRSRADGTPSYLTVGNDEPFDAEKLRALYGD